VGHTPRHGIVDREVPYDGDADSWHTEIRHHLRQRERISALTVRSLRILDIGKHVSNVLRGRPPRYFQPSKRRNSDPARITILPTDVWVHKPLPHGVGTLRALSVRAIA